MAPPSFLIRAMVSAVGVFEIGKDDAMARKGSDRVNLFEHVEQLPRRAVVVGGHMKIVAGLREKPRSTAKLLLHLAVI